MKNTSIIALIFDMDGVLWRENTPLADLEKIFNTLNQKGIAYAFATNNSSRHVNQYTDKLKEFGIPATPDQIFTSGKATAQELKKRYPNRGNVFAIGSNGLIQTLADFGFVNSSHNPPS